MRVEAQELMQSTITRLAYDYRTHTGRVDLPAGCCVDMEGCCAVFEALDPQVWWIETYAGGRPDTFYMRDRYGYWSAQRRDR